MQFNVAGLLKEPVGFTQKISLDERDVGLDGAYAHRLWGQVQLTQVDGGVWAIGDLSARVTSACSRCLQYSETDLNIYFDQTYYPLTDIFAGVAISLPSDADPEFLIDGHHMLDLSEAIRQSIIVSLPSKPLCNKSCSGLCPGCGSNLNESSCTCSEAPIDVRWEPLLSIFSREHN